MVSATVLFVWVFLGISILIYSPVITGIKFIGIIVLSFSINTFIKAYFKKKRPGVMDNFRKRYYLGVQKWSFPSCHAQCAFTAAATISWMFPGFLLGTSILAIVTGVSRTALNRHYIIDVLGGAFLGTVIGLIGSELLFGH